MVHLVNTPYLSAAAVQFAVVAKAIEYGRIAHASIDQRRKYSGEPYNVHTEAVGDMIAEVSSDADVIAASVIHDVREDVPGQTDAVITHEFGGRVAGLVDELTDKFTKELYPHLNRAERHKLEVERLGGISDDAKLIKLADIINNTARIAELDPTFAKVYLAEKAAVLPLLRVEESDAHEALYEIASGQVLPCRPLPTPGGAAPGERFREF